MSEPIETTLQLWAETLRTSATDERDYSLAADLTLAASSLAALKAKLAEAEAQRDAATAESSRLRARMAELEGTPLSGPIRDLVNEWAGRPPPAGPFFPEESHEPSAMPLLPKQQRRVQ